MGRMVCGGMVLVAITLGVTWARGAAAGQETGRSWQDLTPEQRGRAQEHYQRYRELPEHDQRDVEKLYRRWQTLTPAKQAELRRNYERYMSLDPEQQQQFKKQYRRWKADNRRQQREHGR